MPNIFSRRKGRDVERYVRPSLLQLTGSDESIASDATAPNNPGPGRNVGILFDAIGGKIERVVNEIAGRYRTESKGTAEDPRGGSSALSNFSLELAETESIASDATAPNNPGPGRIIGLLFDSGGSKIECFLNRAAGRYRLGPPAVVEDIKKRSLALRFKEHTIKRSIGLEVHLLPTDDEHASLVKKCRKLLKYCRSSVLETQLEALEAVTTLAAEYPPIRQILAGIIRQSHLVPKYKERELHVGYCKALVSVKETQIYVFAKRLENTSERLRRKEISEDNPDFKLLLHQFNLHLRDPNVSFLFGRLLKFHVRMSPAVYRSFTSFALTKPQFIEWDALRNIIIRSAIDDTEHYFDSAHVILGLAHRFPVMQLYDASDLHQSIESFNNRGTTPWDEITDNSACSVWLLSYLSGSSDLATQLQYLHTLDEGTRNLFQGTVFANDLLVAYAHVAQYRDAFIERIQLFSDCFRVAAGLLLEHFDSEDTYQRILAREAIGHSLDLIRYFGSAMAQYGESFFTKPLIMYTNGHNFESRRVFWANVECELYGDVVHVNDVLFDALDLDYFDGHTWLGVDGDDEPFSADGHFPVLAGYDASGKELYVAELGQHGGILSYVPDGARSLSIADRNGEVRMFSRFKVMVLQYDPCSILYCSIPAGAKFQTGYMYWVGEEEGIREEYLSAVDDPHEFSWARIIAWYGVPIGVPKETDKEKRSGASKDDQDSLLENGADFFSEDSTGQEFDSDALETYEGVDSENRELLEDRLKSLLLQRDTMKVEEVQEERRGSRDVD